MLFRSSWHRPVLAVLGGLGIGLAHADAPLTLPDALQRVLARHPGLTAAVAQHTAALGREIQANRLPNPEISTQFESLGPHGVGSAVSQATRTISLSQRIELGDKRTERSAVAAAESRMADDDIRIRRQDLVHDTRLAFIALEAARERLTLARSAEDLAQQVQEAVSARVTAGKVSPIEAARAAVMAGMAQRRTAQGERDLRLARDRLAALWGGEPAAELPAADLSLPDAPYTRAGDMSANPELQRLTQAVERAQAAIRLSDAVRIPDITLSAGIKHEAALGQSLLVGATLPLPLFDRNQGGRQASRAELAAAEAEWQAARLRLTTDLVGEQQQLQAVHAEAQGLHREVLPVAEKAFDDAREAYRAGKFSLLDMLDAQRAWLDARTADLDARVRYHEALADLDRLQGHDITVDEVTP